MKKVVLSALALALALVPASASSATRHPPPMARQCIELKGMERFPGFVFVAEGERRYLVERRTCLRSGTTAIAAVPRSVFARKGLAGLDLSDPKYKWWVVKNIRVTAFVLGYGHHLIRLIHKIWTIVRRPEGGLTISRTAVVYERGHRKTKTNKRP
jgi:hypothetical protein